METETIQKYLKNVSGAHPSRISVLSNDDDCDAPDVILMIIMTIVNIIINITTTPILYYTILCHITLAAFAPPLGRLNA